MKMEGCNKKRLKLILTVVSTVLFFAGLIVIIWYSSRPIFNNYPIFVGNSSQSKNKGCSPPLFENGIYSPNRSKYESGEIVHFSCNEGFYTFGGFASKCRNNTWIRNITCVPKRHCSVLPPPINGSLQSSNKRNPISYEPGDYINFTCNAGFRLYGSATLVCKTDGKWNFEPPICFKGCASVSVKNGRISPKKTTYQIGNTISITCFNGSKLMGNSELNCTQIGWNGELPSCPIVCPILNIPYGSIKLSKEYFTGTIATFSCQEDFRIVGKAKLICSNQGAWNEVAPICYRKRCQGLPPPANGKVSRRRTAFTTGTSITFSCNFGYKLIGNSKLTCQKSEEWDYNVPTCLRTGCPSLSLFSGDIKPKKSLYNFNDSIQIICNYGYKMQGNGNLLCNGSGYWNGSTPYCAWIYCHGLPAPQNGYVSSKNSTYSFNKSVSFSCKRNYKLKGNSTLTCIDHNTWDSDFPSCVIPTCNLHIPSKAVVLRPRPVYRFTESVKFVCEYGYKLIGRNKLTCLFNESWDHEPPTCQKITCNATDTPVNGSFSPIKSVYYQGNTIQFACNSGYNLTGSYKATCNYGKWKTNGLWKPRCIPIACPLLVAPVNLDYVVDPFPYYMNSTVIFKCKTNYILAGSSKLFCQGNGQWDHSIPTCYQQNCTKLSAPPNGKITSKLFEIVPAFLYANRLKTTYFINEFMTFACNSGHTLIGNSTVTCVKPGVWNYPVPTCVKTN